MNIGDIVLGRYKVESVISLDGGTADVYMGRHLNLGSLVAIKQLKIEYKNNQDIIDRFKIEAVAQSNVNHQNIVKVIDYDIDNLCIVMEYIDGKELSYFIDSSLQTKIELFLQILDALCAAHDMGIVHRDLKPSNIIVTNDNFVKVADFGIAKIVGKENSNLTKMCVGTPYYMSPEQIRGDEYISYTTDIYSFGIIMFYIFSGRLPFEGKTEYETTSMHLHSTPPHFEDIGVFNLSKDLENIVLKCINKNPSERYQNSTSLKNDLKIFYNTNFSNNIILKKIVSTKLTMIFAITISIIFITIYMMFFSTKQGYLDILCNRDAKLYIDGTYISQAKGKIAIDEGEHNIVIEVPKYAKKEQNVIIKANETKELTVAFEDSGFISVIGQSGQAINMDNKQIAISPTTIEATVGMHEISINGTKKHVIVTKEKTEKVEF